MINPEVIVQLMDIEKQLWANNPEFYQQALREDAMLVFGETGIISRKFAVDAIKEEASTGKVWEEVALDDLQHRWITEDVVVISYKSSSRWKNTTEMIYALCSSLYNYTEGAWKLVFHQQTPIDQNFIALEKSELT